MGALGSLKATQHTTIANHSQHQLKPMEQHERLKQLIETAGSTYMSVVFLKKDGSERQLTFNPKDHNDIKGTGKPTTDPNIFRIRDNTLQQWRSFDARRVLRVKIRGTETNFQEDQE